MYFKICVWCEVGVQFHFSSFGWSFAQHHLLENPSLPNVMLSALGGSGHGPAATTLHGSGKTVAEFLFDINNMLDITWVAYIHLKPLLQCRNVGSPCL